MTSGNTCGSSTHGSLLINKSLMEMRANNRLYIICTTLMCAALHCLSFRQHAWVVRGWVATEGTFVLSRRPAPASANPDRATTVSTARAPNTIQHPHPPPEGGKGDPERKHPVRHEAEERLLPPAGLRLSDKTSRKISPKPVAPWQVGGGIHRRVLSHWMDLSAL